MKTTKKPKHTYILIACGEEVTDADLWATSLCLASRGGTQSIAGAESRYERDRLAAELQEGVLAESLWSDRPIRVWCTTDCYVFEEL